MRARGGRTLPTVAGAVTVLLALGACGTDTVGLAAGPTADLHERVSAVRASTAIGDPEAAQAALEAFRAEVHRLVESGELDAAEAVDLLAQADRVAARLAVEVAPAVERTPQPNPDPTPRPASRTRSAPERSELSAVLADLIRERMREHAERERPDHGKRDGKKDGEDDRHDDRD